MRGERLGKEKKRKGRRKRSWRRGKIGREKGRRQYFEKVGEAEEKRAWENINACEWRRSRESPSVPK